MKQPLVVTTEYRGVFFGYGELTTLKTIRLENARMCIAWPDSNHGIVGLAKDGPKKGAQVGPAAPAITLQNVTAVFETTKEAVTRWESEPWS